MGTLTRTLAEQIASSRRKIQELEHQLREAEELVEDRREFLRVVEDRYKYVPPDSPRAQRDLSQARKELREMEKRAAKLAKALERERANLEALEAQLEEERRRECEEARAQLPKQAEELQKARNELLQTLVEIAPSVVELHERANAAFQAFRKEWENFVILARKAGEGQHTWGFTGHLLGDYRKPVQELWQHVTETTPTVGVELPPGVEKAAQGLWLLLRNFGQYREDWPSP